MRLGRHGGIADRHTEALGGWKSHGLELGRKVKASKTHWWKGLDGLPCQIVPRQVKLRVVDRQSALGAV